MATYNRIYTKEKWNMVNEFNKSFLEDYMLQIKAEKKSVQSQKQYFNDARIILIYILEELNNECIFKLNRKSFRNMILWMQDCNMSANRINRLLSTLRNLLNFGLDDDEYSDEFENNRINPARIKGLHRDKIREIYFLTNEEILNIYNSLVKERKFSQALYLALSYDSAGRRNEIFQVKREDLSYDSNVTKRKVKGKGNKTFRLIYNNLTKEALKLFDDNVYLNETNKNELWISSLGTKCSYETLYTWVVSWRKYLSGDKKINPHSFRHSSLELLKSGEHYIAKSLNKKFELKELKLFAHHNDIGTTDGYLKNNDEEMLLQAFGIE